MHLVLVCGMILLVEMLERLVSLCLSNASLGLNLRIPLPISAGLLRHGVRHANLPDQRPGPIHGSSHI